MRPTDQISDPTWDDIQDRDKRIAELEDAWKKALGIVTFRGEKLDRANRDLAEALNSNRAMREQLARASVTYNDDQQLLGDVQEDNVILQQKLSAIEDELAVSQKAREAQREYIARLEKKAEDSKWSPWGASKRTIANLQESLELTERLVAMKDETFATIELGYKEEQLLRKAQKEDFELKIGNLEYDKRVLGENSLKLKDEILKLEAVRDSLGGEIQMLREVSAKDQAEKQERMLRQAKHILNLEQRLAEVEDDSDMVDPELYAQLQYDHDVMVQRNQVLGAELANVKIEYQELSKAYETNTANMHQAIRNSSEQCKKSCDALRAEVLRKEGYILTLKKNIRECHETVATQRETIGTLQDRIAKIAGQRLVMRENMDRKEQRIATLEKQRIGLQRDRTELLDAREKLRQVNGKLQQELKDVGGLERQYNILAKEYSELGASVRIAAGMISTMEQYKDKHPMEVHGMLIEYGKQEMEE